MLVHWIWLATRFGISDRMKKIIAEAMPDAEEIYYANADGLASLEGMTPEILESLLDKDLLEAEEILQKCEKKQIRICTYQDGEYPVRLKNIADPPMVLYYKGQIPDMENVPVIGVVGTRKASAYGMTVAADMGYQIARCGGVVVSGAADGIDSMAMQGALLADKPVIAVLGCGADVVYPAHNKKLYADTQQHGCLITEFPPEEKPLGWHFPRRNRIISGLSNGVLVVEAPEDSGALITARRAADQGRDVFVVPGNIGVKSCMGSNALLREGAISVTSGWDVVSEYAYLYPENVREASAVSVAGQVVSGEEKQALMVAQKPKTPGMDRKNEKKKEKKPIDNSGNRGYSDQSRPMPTLTEEEKQVLAGLENTCLVDDLIARLNMPAGKVLSCLTMLQIKGLVRQLPGNRVAPIG